MTELLEQAMALMCDLPEEIQNKAARQLMQYIDEMSDLNDRDAIAESPVAFERMDS